MIYKIFFQLSTTFQSQENIFELTKSCKSCFLLNVYNDIQLSDYPLLLSPNPVCSVVYGLWHHIWERWVFFLITVYGNQLQQQVQFQDQHWLPPDAFTAIFIPFSPLCSLSDWQFDCFSNFLLLLSAQHNAEFRK